MVIKTKNLVRQTALTRYTSIPAKKAALTIELSDKAFMPSLYSTQFKGFLNEDTHFLVTNVMQLIHM